VKTPQPARARQSPPASVTTRPLRFSGSDLFVNAAVTGSLRVEVLDREGRVIEPFSAAKAVPVTGDATRTAVGWRSGASLKTLSGEIVRFRFSLNRARLYAFWVSGSPSGASGGYVAAGGPGFRTGRDA